MKITLIGLGNVCGDLTLRAKAALDASDCIIARSCMPESFKSLNGYDVRALDGVFASSRNFDTLNKNLAAEVLKAAKERDVCYCVDGSVTEDEACKIILSKHKDCLVLDTVSKGAAVYSAARLKSSSPVFVSAYSVGNLKSCAAACVYDIDCEYVASEVKIRLSDIFGEETDCCFYDGKTAKKIKIYELDRMKNYDGPCSVAVEEGDFLKKERYDYSDLDHMIKLLRAPGGCPWDRSQTPDSIKKDMIEEAYELVDAIERRDVDGMEEETGDVLLQAAFHAVMAEERGEFNSTDVLTRLIKKLIFRHSHVFGSDKVSDANAALSLWEKNKKTEKEQTTYGETLLAVPKNFPSCMRAQKVGKRAAKCGFDFYTSVSASEKIWEEVQEMVACQMEGDEKGTFEEAGDVLFAAVNTVRLAGVDCEEALRAATDKFIRRFVKCEELIIADGKKIEDVTGDELLFNVYWERAKDETCAD